MRHRIVALIFTILYLDVWVLRLVNGYDFIDVKVFDSIIVIKLQIILTIQQLF